MRRARLVSLIVGCWLAACAQGVPAGSSGDDEPAPPDAGSAADAPEGDTPDAAVSDTDAAPGAPDAAPAPDARPAGPITLSQTTSDAITSGAGCYDRVFGANESIAFYRAFKLSDFGVSGELAVSEVQFGVAEARAGGGSQPVSLRLHTLDGDVVRRDRFTEIAATTVTVPNGEGQVAKAPIAATVPAGGTLVVELSVASSFNYFALGANSGGERVPAYVRSAFCNVSELAELARQTNPPKHALISVTGTPR